MIDDGNKSHQEEEMLVHCGYNVSETYPVSQVILRVYCILPAILLGLIGNLVSIVIFVQRAMRASPTNWFLLTLAFSDSVLLVSTFNMLTFPVMAERANILIGHVAAQYLTRIFYPLSQLAQTTSVYMVVAVTVHRFLGICHPFVAQRHSTRHNVKLVIFLTALFAFLFTMPRWIHLSLESCYSRSFDALSVVITTGPLYNNTLYKWAYNIVGYVIVMFLLPFCSLVVLDILLIVAVQKSTELQRRTTTVRRRQWNNTSRSSGEQQSRTDQQQQMLLCQTKSLGVVKAPPSPPSTKTIKRRSSLIINNHNHKDETNIGSSGGFNIEQQSFSSPNKRPKLSGFTVRRTLTLQRSKSVKGGYRRDLAKETPNSAKETNITLMLITIVTLFLLTNTLPFINNILEHFIYTYIHGSSSSSGDQESSFGQTFQILVETGNFLVTVNSGAYVLIYYFFNQKYRQIFAKTFCRRGGERDGKSGGSGRPPITSSTMVGYANKNSKISYWSSAESARNNNNNNNTMSVVKSDIDHENKNSTSDSSTFGRA